MSVVVAIPTFKRPAGLKRLLDEVALIDVPVRVIVADNDVVDGEGALLAEGLIAFPHPLQVVRTRERGIAQARNALVAAAIAHREVTAIAMIDDDERPCAGWLEALLETKAATGADIIGGPVLRRFAVPVPGHVAAANNYNVGQRKTGVVDLVDATSNVLFDAAIFREADGPWFDDFFAMTGGEDKDLMIGLKMRGKTFAWCDEARVEELLPASRCTTQWAVQRAFSTGNSDMLVNLRRRPPGFSASSESLKILGALAVALLNLSVLSFSAARRFEGRRLGARAAGKLAALFGHRHLEYRTIHGQ